MANGRIKQINTGTSTYDIEALYFGNRSASDWEGMIHGVVDTYVIPAQTAASGSDYAKVVEATTAQVSTTKSILNTLTSSSNDYKVGDIILMGATSDGKINFDRWVSKIEGTTITLDVLETQVATHHHTITRTSAKALTGINASSTTTATMAKVGSAVTVATGGAGGVVTSVVFSGSGSNSLSIATATSTDGVGHSHTVNSHTHSVGFTPTTLVSRSIDAVTSLTSAEYTPHTHATAVTAAGSKTDGSAFSYVYGGGKTTFITSLKDDSSTTSSTSLTTNANTVGLSTSTTASTEKTTTVASHVHSVSATTTENVVKSVTLTANPLISAKLTFTAPTVQTSVVTSVTYTSTKAVSSVTTGSANFFNSCSVVDGVLSFGSSTVITSVSYSTKTVASTITGTINSQSAGSASLTTASAAQSYTSGKVTATCNTGAAGEHSHGFSHSHTIAEHTHTIASHTHTYNKSVKDGTGSAYTSLSTSSYTPHTHSANVTAAGSNSASTKITYIKEGSKTTVVRDMISSAKSFTTSSAAPGTSTQYYKLSGSITHPGLTVVSKDISTLISTTSITPAASSDEKPLKSITFTSAYFINTVTQKTSKNVGGE